MHSSSLLATLALSTGCHVRPESFLPAGSHNQPVGSDFLTGKPAAFVIVSEEESRAWPTLLQQMLDAHAGRAGTYLVSTASPRELDGTTWPGVLSELSSAGAEREATALCLLTLAGVGDTEGPVKGEHDMVGAEMGADALEGLARELQGAGLERVAFATPVYSASAGPELGFEHLAIQRLLARGLRFVEAGPDLYRASKKYYPDAYRSDGEEPNEFGMKLLAEEWYRWLAGPEASEEVVQALYAGSLSQPQMETP
jgi:hypothetical protein